MRTIINTGIYLLLALTFLTNLNGQGLNNGLIRSGDGAENSINSSGTLQQPWYYNGDVSEWFKLTFYNYPLDYAIGVGGDGASDWNTNGTIMDNPVLTGQTINSNGFFMTGTYTGYGTLISSGTINLNGQNFLVEQFYALPQSSGFLQIRTRVTNQSAAPATNVRIWVGTRDDWVGNDDGPTKMKGNIVNGAFVQIPDVSVQSQAMQIISGQEAVLVYSPSNRGYMISHQCCSFYNVINQNPLTIGTGFYSNLNGPSWTGDGSYGFYVRMNDLAPGESDEFDWYYAAGSLSDIADIITEVAIASGGIADLTCTTATYDATASLSGTGYWIVVPNNSTTPTAQEIKAGVNYGSVQVAASGLGPITADVEQPFYITGLTAGTTYKLYFVVEDATPAFSDIDDVFFATLNTITWYEDSDDDGYGNASVTMTACSTPALSGYVLNNTDCDDTNGDINPGATEILGNGIDDNCNGLVDVLPYCEPAVDYPCLYIWITNVTLANINNASGCSSGGYTDFTTLSASLEPNATYSISISGNNYDNQQAAVFVDWNRDGDFEDSGERVVNNITVPYNSPASSSITIPGNASGTYIMRVISDYYQITNPCHSQYGEVEDYRLQLTPLCPDMDGDGYFPCHGDCDDANANVYPGATEILSNGLDDDCDGLTDILPYCEPTVDAPCEYMWLTNVTIGSINNSSECSGGYSNYSSLSTPVTPGNTYTISLTGGGSFDQFSSVFVDWNADGDFEDAGETVVFGLYTFYYQANSRSFMVPANATGGNRRMRVVSIYYAAPTSCYTNYGEVEDYTLVVTSSCVEQTWYLDADSDGYYTGAGITQCESPGAGYRYTGILGGADCNDDNAAINPAASEVCDGIDNNCNSSIDEGVLTTYYRDMDMDGFGNPAVTQMACSQPSGYVTDNTDCNDNNALEKPGQIWYKDSDGDGYAETGAPTINQCLRPAGYKVASELASTTGDCNDGNAAINPAASEVCDGIDNNCNSMTDEGVLTTYYRDMDMDGFGNPAVTQMACSQPSGYVTDNTDCNDNNALEKPGQIWYKDSDGDGYAETDAPAITQCLRPVDHKAATELANTTGDCNDNNAAINPAATEVCDGIDNDCDDLMDSDDLNYEDNTPPTLSCASQATLNFNGELSIQIDGENSPLDLQIIANDNCGIFSTVVSPGSISVSQLGQSIPVTITVKDAKGNPATCITTVNVTGLPAGWSQDLDGVNCEEGNSIAYNTTTSVWTATSSNCYYDAPFTSDETAFAQRTLCGDGMITAKVTGISGTSLGWAGVAMRESNAAGAKMAQLMTNLSNFSRREFRTDTDGSANPQQFPSQNRYWLRIVRSGNQFTMFASPNGAIWYPVGAQNIAMDDCIQMGLVVTNYTANSTVTATFSNVSYTGGNQMLSLPGAAVQITPSQAEFSVFPNPTSGELNVDLIQYAGKAVRIEVYGLEGRLLQFSEIDEVQTAIESLNLIKHQAGMYLVKVKSEGLPDATKRVVLIR